MKGLDAKEKWNIVILEKPDILLFRKKCIINICQRYFSSNFLEKKVVCNRFTDVLKRRETDYQYSQRGIFEFGIIEGRIPARKKDAVSFNLIKILQNKFGIICHICGKFPGSNSKPNMTFMDIMPFTNETRNFRLHAWRVSKKNHHHDVINSESKIY